MSYRTLKRVLGETSLERKCRFLFGCCLMALITGSFWWYGRNTEKLLFKQNPIKGQLLVDTILLMEHWDRLQTQTEEEVREAERLGRAYRPWVKDITENLANRSYQWTFIKPYLTHTGENQPQDDFEKAALETFKAYRPPPQSTRPPAQNPTNPQPSPLESLPTDFALAPRSQDPLAPEPVDRNLGQFYQYYQPIYASDTRCVDCHKVLPRGPGLMIGGISDDAPSVPRIKEGDLIAVAKVTFPNDATTHDLNENTAILLTTAIITVALAMLASWVIVRYVIVKPLKHLREVSDAISHGKIDQRAEIHTGDEFETLGVAFNRMLRHLVEAQAELRNVNADLDGKVDELAQMNMRLYEMNRLKGDFLANMSHELRTPLNSIIGFSDVLGTISSLDEKQKRYVQNIQKSGKMLLDMINEILDLAKIESGKMEPRPSHFHIAHVISDMCNMCRPLTEKKNIDLDIVIQPGLPELFQDQSKVQQILNNLLSNGIKFTPEGGRIHIAAERDGENRLVLEVSDTGVGIAEEDQPHIFEKFRQGKVVIPAGDAMTREYSGTGLGLSIVNELCRLLGGEISMVSELGKGSTFTVRLPWSLPDKPRPDSTMADQLSELTRPRRGEYMTVQSAN